MPYQVYITPLTFAFCSATYNMRDHYHIGESDVINFEYPVATDRFVIDSRQKHIELFASLKKVRGVNGLQPPTSKKNPSVRAKINAGLVSVTLLKAHAIIPVLEYGTAEWWRGKRQKTKYADEIEVEEKRQLNFIPSDEELALIKRLGTRKAVFARDGECLMCGAKGNLTIDHVIPKVLGGKNCYANYQTACERCNHNKGSKFKDCRDHEKYL